MQNYHLEKTTGLDSNFTNLLLLTRLKGYTRPSVQALKKVFSGAIELQSIANNNDDIRICLYCLTVI